MRRTGFSYVSAFVRACVVVRAYAFVAACACLSITAARGAAEPGDTQTRISAASEGMTRPYSHPAIDDAKALRGAPLLAALRQGGLILFMRHTQTGTVTPQCTVSNLTPAGERDARFVGEAIRSLRIPIGRVLSSPVCRVADTARLLGLGAPELSADFSNVPTSPDTDLGALRAKRLAEAPAPGTNVMIASHMQSGKSQAHWIHMDFGEIVVFKPDGQGRSDAIARIRADDWYDLMAAEKK